MSISEILLPGDSLPYLPTTPLSKVIKFGPGLRHIHASVSNPTPSIIPIQAGEFNVDTKKSLAWLESAPARYIPHPQDPVIAIVTRSTLLNADVGAYICSIPSGNSNQPVTAILRHLAFENATKKTRPVLSTGSVIYARISSVTPRGLLEPELECFDAETGRASGYGELKGGMLFTISLALARRLLGDGKKLRQLKIKKGETARELKGMSTGMEVLDELGKRVAFEIAIGRNGRVWVDSESIKVTLCVGRCIQDSESLTGEEQRKLVRERISEFGL